MQGSPFRVYRLCTFNVIDICGYKVFSSAYAIRQNLARFLSEPHKSFQPGA